MTDPSPYRAAALTNKAWVFDEARKQFDRYPQPPAKGEIVFETGYGPSGLPHIGVQTAAISGADALYSLNLMLNR